MIQCRELWTPREGTCSSAAHPGSCFSFWGLNSLCTLSLKTSRFFSWAVSFCTHSWAKYKEQHIWIEISMIKIIIAEVFSCVALAFTSLLIHNPREAIGAAWDFCLTFWMKYESLDLSCIKAPLQYVIVLLFVQFQTYNMFPRPLATSTKTLLH